MHWNDLDSIALRSERRATFHESLNNRDGGVLFIGLLMCLLSLGLVKAIYGLFCPTIGLCCLGFYVPVPGRLRSYYEEELKGYDVVYDCSGWPIHPETLERSVMVMSRSKQFLLNTIFFLTIPVAAVWSVVNCLFLCEDRVEEPSPNNPPKKNRRLDPEEAYMYGETIDKLCGKKARKNGHFFVNMANKTYKKTSFKDSKAGVSKRDVAISAPKCKCNDCMKSGDYFYLREFRDFYKNDYKDDDSSSETNSSDTQFIITEMNRSKQSMAQIESILTKSKVFEKSASN